MGGIPYSPAILLKLLVGEYQRKAPENILQGNVRIEVGFASLEGRVGVFERLVEGHSSELVEGDVRRSPASAVDTAVEEVLGPVGASELCDVLCRTRGTAGGVLEGEETGARVADG